jgi:hypothetical protein
MKRFFFFLLLSLSQYLFAGDLFDGLTPRSFKLADKLETDAVFGGYPIWRGEGKWRIFNVARTDSTHREPVPIGNVGLFQTEGKKFVAIMTMSANLAGASGRWLGEPCKRDDMLFKAEIGNSTWQDNCVTINHISNYANNPGGRDAELYALFVESGVDAPPTVIQVQFTRNGTSGNFYNIRLSLNPEVMGFKRETEVNWGRNPWNKTMSFNDPTKKQFIDALGVWALQFAKQMDSALDKKADAFTSIQSWRTVLDGQLKPNATKPKVSLD